MDQDEAVTNIQFVEQRQSNDDYTDLAAGAGGTNRYLKMLRDTSKTRIKKVGLLRTPNGQGVSDSKKYGWDRCTYDINTNRGGDCLYLCWNTITV